MGFNLFKKRVGKPRETRENVNANAVIAENVYNKVKFLPKEFFIFTRDFSTDYHYYNEFSSKEVESCVQKDFRPVGGSANGEFREFEFDDYSIYMYIFNDGNKDEYGRDIMSWLCAIVDKGFAGNYTISDFKREIECKVDSFGSLKYNRWDLANEFINDWKIDISTKLYSQSKTI